MSFFGNGNAGGSPRKSNNNNNNNNNNIGSGRNNTVYLRSFNDCFFAFLSRAGEILPSPHDAEAVVASASAAALKKTNPTIIIKAWQQHVAIKYAAHIADNDFSFFTGKDYSEDIDQFSQKDRIMALIETLRASLALVDTNHQNELFGYVRQLTALSIEYHKQR
jgi:hypothetical protein